MVEFGEGGVESLADFVTLEGARGGEDCELGHAGGDIDGASGALEVGAARDVFGDFFGDQGDIGTECF